jgi:hypothetical protein
MLSSETTDVRTPRGEPVSMDLVATTFRAAKHGDGTTASSPPLTVGGERARGASSRRVDVARLSEGSPHLLVR